MEEDNKIRLEKINKRAGLAFKIIVVFILANASLIIFFDTEKSGQIGDTFGAVNAFFSGCAFVGLVYTILLQHSELKLTQGELEKQRETLRKQHFESTFFNMLNLYNEIVGAMETHTEKGRKVFTYLFSYIRDNWNNIHLQPTELRTIENLCENYYKNWHHHLGHYFRNVYRIIKFVDESDLSEEDRQNYIKILRAQLSNHELVMLLYNSAYYSKGKNFKKYIEKYALLNNLPKELILDEEHMKAFSEKAYGGKYPE